MPKPPIVLANRHLTARFDPENGMPIFLGESAKGKSCIEATYCQYSDGQPPVPVTEAAGAARARAFKVIAVAVQPSQIVSVVESDRVQVARVWSLPPDSPLLKASVTVQGVGEPAELKSPAFPHVQFAKDFLDAFEDDQDLAFDGAELGDGRELPCWRVLFRPGHKEGVLIAARNKREMSHFQIYAQGFDIKPHVMTAYDTDYVLALSPLDTKRSYVAHFEIGPWRQSRHAAILRAAHLGAPVKTNNPPIAGPAPRKLKGRVFRALSFAPESAVSSTLRENKWMIAPMPFAQGGKALFVNPGYTAPTLTLDPKLKGVYRIFIGIGQGGGVMARLTGDPEDSLRVNSDPHARFTPFHLSLSGRQRPQEVSLRTAKMDGKRLTVARFPNLSTPMALDYVRFEKLSPAQEKAWLRQETRKPCVPLTGLNDIPDIEHLVDPVNPDPAAYRANVWEHANCGFKAIYWRIDGQCSDYPSKVNTMRYISARSHGVYYPQGKAYGRVLRKTDILRLAVEAGRKYGVEIYGWMRFNSYMGNVQSDFFKQNPQYHEEWESGSHANKICLAFPEVRQHKIDILCEAAGYGLQGLNLGFLRHPPVLHYAPILVEGYKKKYGVEPPRDRQRPDATYLKSLPPTDPETTRWFQYRADFLTTFGRDLKAALRAKGLGHVRIAIWVRPNHCLFDGIDLPVWLKEGLCDEVVAGGVSAGDQETARVYGVQPAWQKLVQEHVPLYGDITCSYPLARILTKRFLDAGFDGLCTYESDITVLDSRFIALYRRLRR